MPRTHQTGLWDVLLRPKTLDENNQRNVLVDGIGVGLASGVGTFLSVFLVRLGASSFLVGLLTALPALAGILLATWACFPLGAYTPPRISPNSCERQQYDHLEAQLLHG